MTVATCGVEKTVQGRSAPLVCNLEAGHELPHGVREREGLPPYVRWPVAWQPDVRELAARDAWRKPHKRREYQTTAMWKARQR